MKKKYAIICLIVIFAIAIGGAVYTVLYQDNQRLYRSVRSYVNRHGNSVVSLGSMTDFRWEKALYFKHPTSHQEIEDAIGIRYTGETDLIAGLIFVNEGEIVYYELMRRDFDHLFTRRSRFSFNPRISHEDESNIRIFLPDDIFEIGKSDTAGNYYLYWMEYCE